jgi:hypothetical protein
MVIEQIDFIWIWQFICSESKQLIQYVQSINFSEDEEDPPIKNDVGGLTKRCSSNVKPHSRTSGMTML